MNLAEILNSLAVALGVVVVIDNALADIPSINANSTFQAIRRGLAGALKALTSVQSEIAPKSGAPVKAGAPAKAVVPPAPVSAEAVVPERGA